MPVPAQCGEIEQYKTEAAFFCTNCLLLQDPQSSPGYREEYGDIYTSTVAASPFTEYAKIASKQLWDSAAISLPSEYLNELVTAEVYDGHGVLSIMFSLRERAFSIHQSVRITFANLSHNNQST
jgi:hypothetical protein